MVTKERAMAERMSALDEKVSRQPPFFPYYRMQVDPTSYSRVSWYYCEGGWVDNGNGPPMASFEFGIRL